jgi:hypothetical protein
MHKDKSKSLLNFLRRCYVMHELLLSELFDDLFKDFICRDGVSVARVLTVPFKSFWLMVMF